MKFIGWGGGGGGGGGGGRSFLCAPPWIEHRRVCIPYKSFEWQLVVHEIEPIYTDTLFLIQGSHTSRETKVQGSTSISDGN